MPRKGEYYKLLEDPNVRDWYEDLLRGSQITAKVYLRRLGSFCKAVEVTPKALADSDSKDIEDLLRKRIHFLESQGKAGGYLGSILKAIRSWADWNGKKPERKIKIANRDQTPTIENERVPSKDEMRKVLYSDKTSLRARASISLLAFTGLRLESLGDYSGRDGLKIRDFPEMQIEGTIQFEKIPTIVSVRSNLSKSRHPYLSFLALEGSQIVTELLERRRLAGERLTLETPIIASSPAYDPRGRFGAAKREMRAKHITTPKISEEIRESLRSNHFGWRPYIFRSYFDTALMLAESKGKVSHAYAQFWMGHKGDIEARYTTRKKLLEDVVEDMREAYRKCEENIVTNSFEGTSEDKIRRRLQEQWLLVAGFKPDEIEKMNLEGMSDEELQRAVREKLLGIMANNGASQKVIPTSELEDYIARGWEFKSTVNSDKVVIQLPH